MVFHDDGLEFSVAENVGNLRAQILASGATVRGVANLATDVPRLGNDIRIGYLARNAEGHQAGRVGVNDGRQLGAGVVDGLVEGVFRRRLVRPADGSVMSDADDVLGGQRAFIDARRRDPDVAALILD